MATSTRPALETGWRPETPVDDTMLRRCVLGFSATWEAAAAASGARQRIDDRYAAVDHGRPTGLFNSVTLHRPLFGADLARALDEIERFYDTQGGGTALLWSPWPTPDLADRGWQLQGHPPLLVRNAQLPVEQRIPDDLTVAEVTDPAAFTEWRTVAVEGFPFEDVRAPTSLIDDATRDDDRFRFVIGRVDSRAVAVGCQFIEHGLNVLLLAATRPEFRGRGYYSALAAHRIAHAPHLPDVAIVSDDSRPILVDRFGFMPVTRFTLWGRPCP